MEAFELVKPGRKELLLEGLDQVLGREAARSVYDRIVHRIGEEPVTVLGAGDRGVAYGLPSGKVLKITSDEGELRAMNLLRGHGQPNLVQVFDAFFVPVPGAELIPVGTPKRGVGAIVREAVDDTVADSGGAYRKLDSLLRELTISGNDLFIRRRKGGMPERQAAWEAMIHIRERLADEPPKELMPGDRLLLPGILAAIDELLNLGIYVVDFQGSNVGLILGRPALFDLSLASVPKTSPDIQLGHPLSGGLLDDDP